MTPPDRITYCDQCGWTGEVTERCPDCERDERICAANAVEIWDHACELADHLRAALPYLPNGDPWTEIARKSLKSWDTTANAITNP